MSMRSVGFTQLDFQEMSLDELYLRYCIEAEKYKEK